MGKWQKSIKNLKVRHYKVVLVHFLNKTTCLVAGVRLLKLVFPDEKIFTVKKNQQKTEIGNTLERYHFLASLICATGRIPLIFIIGRAKALATTELGVLTHSTQSKIAVREELLPEF